MALDFPDTPTVGEEFTVGLKKFKWDGVKWANISTTIITKDTVGLGNVQNFGVANKLTAEIGEANNVYMTPLRVKQAMDASGSNVDITDLFPENPRPGDLWWDSENGTLRIYYEDGDSGQWVEVVNAQGQQGSAATIQVGSTSTLAPGEQAFVNNIGSTGSAVLNFGIPRGADVNIGTTTIVNPDQDPSVSDSGTPGNVILDFSLPRANSISLGNVSSVNPDQLPSIEDVGLNGNVILDVELPRVSNISIGTTNTISAGDPALVTNTGTDGDLVLNFDIPGGAGITDIAQNPDGTFTLTYGETGVSIVEDIPVLSNKAFMADSGPQNPDNGDFWWDSENATLRVYYEDEDSGQWVEVINAQGQQGEAGTISLGSVQTIAPSQDAFVTNTGSTGDAVFNFGVPRGSNVSLGTTTIVSPDVDPSITDTGTDGDVVLNFNLPRSNTISINSITTINPDQNPTIIDSGVGGDIALDISMPRASNITVGTTTTISATDPAAVTDTGNDGDVVLNFSIPGGAGITDIAQITDETNPDFGKFVLTYGDTQTSIVEDIPVLSNKAFMADEGPADPDNGDFWWDAANATLRVYYEDEDSGQWVEVINAQGRQGQSASVQLGNIESLDPNEQLTITNTGTLNEAVLNFGIPRGSNVSVGNINIVNPNQDPNVVNSGSGGDVVLDFTLPRANTVALGSVTEVNPNQSPNVNNSGTNGNVILDFTLPRANSVSLGNVSIVNPAINPSVTDVGENGDVVLDFTLPRANSVLLGDLTVLNPTEDPFIVNTGVNGDVVLNLGLPKTSSLTLGTTTTVNPDQDPLVTNRGLDGDLILDFALPRANSISFGTVSVVNPDQDPTVINSGEDGDVVLDFTLPRANSISFGTVSVVNPDQDPTVANSGADGDIVLDFTLPRSNSVSLGTTTIATPNTDPSVINSGLNGNVVLDFTLPRANSLSLGTFTELNPNQSPSITDVGTSGDIVLNIGLPKAASVTVGTVENLIPNSLASVVNSGTDGNVVLDFGIPTGLGITNITDNSDGTVTIDYGESLSSTVGVTGYAPTSPGTTGQVLVSAGDPDLPVWVDITDALFGTVGDIPSTSLSDNAGKYVQVKSDGTGYAFVNLSGQTAGSIEAGFLNYSGSLTTAGQFNGTNVDPTATERVNYEGYFYATRVYNAVYNDLAEFMEVKPGEELNPGDIVSSTRDGLVKSKPKDRNVVGVVSDTYGYALGAADRETKAPIGLSGRVLVHLEGGSNPEPGDLLIAGENGKARIDNEPSIGTVIGKIYDSIRQTDGRYWMLIMNG